MGCPGVSISCCKKLGVGRAEAKCKCEVAYDLSAVDSNYEVVPGLDGYVAVLVSKDLETERGLFVARGRMRRAF